MTSPHWNHWKRSAIAVVLVGLIAIGFVGLGLAHLSHARAAPALPPAPAAAPGPAATAPPSGSSPQAIASALPDFSAIVRQHGAAVVNVSTAGMARTGLDASPDTNDPFWRFFRHFGIPQPQGEVPVRGLGSGFIVRSDGVILTNAHVVDSATEVRVKLTDRREFPAKVIGLDKATDVAVLKIDARNLPTVNIGDSARAQVGQWVLAIGSPFGFENSATAGIVSATARSLPNEGYVPFLQTDVAVNPGNSGGPLFNLAGQVIGINSQIYSRSGGYMGLSFAIPIDVAMNVEGQILAHGRVVRGQLGVTVQDVTQALAQSFGLGRPIGALVSSVEKGSPAAKAGLEPGDVILSLDGQGITTSSDLPPRVADLNPGSRARLDVWRKGGHREIDVVVGESKEAAVASAGGPAEHGRLGIVVRQLTPEEQQQDGVHGGVLVEGVSGPAARAGLEPGDVVLSLNGTPVVSVEQLRGLLDKAGKQVAVLVQRGQARIFVPVALG